MKTLYDRLKPELKTIIDNENTYPNLKEYVLESLNKQFWVDLTWRELDAISQLICDFDFNFPNTIFD